MIQTIIIASVIALILVAIVVNEIHKKKTGKFTSPCGRNCGACGLCHPKSTNEESDRDGE